jgi:uncharacterized BrkB/YihY/UPF0761 family membrane protein
MLFGSFFFSLMESCFDVIYHLPPRPFLRRHLVAMGMLLVFVALTTISMVVATAPTFVLSLVQLVPLGAAAENGLAFRLISIAGGIISSLLLFQAI